MKSILIIEDDIPLLKGLEISLQEENFHVSTAMDGNTGFMMARNQRFDLILLDIMLPYKNGIEICKNLREEGISDPVIMLTSKSEEMDKIEGFKAGADDYLTKPFSLSELKARINAILRRFELTRSSINEKENFTAHEETRVFMFLDINSATTIAEQLGHIRYHNLLNDFFCDISFPVEQCEGEIYQYVGDEISISWPLETGIRNANCIKLYFSIYDLIDKMGDKYEHEYGLLPTFKASVHAGPVMVGKVGSIRETIVYSGDVLNTTSRIQGLCKKYNCPLLISKDLSTLLPKDHSFNISELGNLSLRGKKHGKEICAVHRN